MTSILKADEIQDSSGNLIIKEVANAITIGASGDTITIPSGATLSNLGTASGFGITEADMWRITTEFQGSVGPITANWERCDEDTFEKIGTGMSVSSGYWTFPTTGLYYVNWKATFRLNGETQYAYVHINTTANNSSYTERAISFGMIPNISANAYCHGMCDLFINVTDTANDKLYFGTNVQNSSTYTLGNSGSNYANATFIRLAGSQ